MPRSDSEGNQVDVVTLNRAVISYVHWLPILALRLLLDSPKRCSAERSIQYYSKFIILVSRPTKRRTMGKKEFSLACSSSNNFSELNDTHLPSFVRPPLRRRSETLTSLIFR